MRRAWIFDLDGTLTVPMHDFSGFKVQLGLPVDVDILTGIAQRPPEQRASLLDAVRAWEEERVEVAVAAEGAAGLLDALAGRPVGIVTRNTRESALRTLDVIGLAPYFRRSDVLGRDCEAPKPAPDALLRLISGWGLPPTEVVMVGDHLDDVRAGRAAGTQTVWVDVDQRGHLPPEADHVVRGLTELHHLL